MRVISQSRLKAFWQSPGRADAEGSLRAWYTHVNSKTVTWHTWSDVKSAFAAASIVGNCIVFNIRGNNYRLVTRVLYPSQKVFILKVMTHVEYDRNKWKDECGCFAPPPPRPATACRAKPTPRRNPKAR